MLWLVFQESEMTARIIMKFVKIFEMCVYLVF